ncbi:MAG: Ig-like domain-containing protein [Bdellovibrionota bacterium]
MTALFNYTDRVIRSCAGHVGIPLLTRLGLFVLFAIPTTAIAQPLVTLSHSQALIDDANGDGQANPGDIIGYTVQVTNSGSSAANNLVVTVSPDPNTSPIPGSFNVHPFAVTDQTSITEDAVPNTVNGNVLLNDSGTDAGETMVVNSFGGSGLPGSVNGSFGSLTWAADGTFTYALNNALPAVNQLATGQILTEQFPYTITDGSGFTSSDFLKVTINGVNDAPATVADSYQTFNNSKITVDTAHGLLANDTDAEGQTLTISSADSTSTLGAAVSVATDGSFVYTPTTLTTGQTDTFNYVARDTAGALTSGTASLVAIGRILFVDNTNVSGTGTFADPYDNLFSAVSSNQPNDIVFVYRGNGTNSRLDQAYIIAADNVQIIGESTGLSLNGVVQIPAGLPPVIGTDPMISQHVSFSVTNKSFTLRGVTFSGDGAQFSKAFSGTYNDGLAHALTVSDVLASGEEIGFNSSVTNGSALTVQLNQVKANSNQLIGFAVGAANNSSIIFSATGSQFVDNGTGLQLSGIDTSSLTASMSGNTFRTPTTTSEGFRLSTDNSATATVSFTGTNTVTSNLIGLILFSRSSNVPTVNITNNNSITTNSVGICNDSGEAVLNIVPASQLSGNDVDIDSGNCGG